MTDSEVQEEQWGFSGYRGISQEAKFLLLQAVLEAVGATLPFFLLALYLDHLGYSSVIVGYVLLIMGLSTTIFMLPGGYLGDRFGRRRMIFVGLGMKALGLLVLIMADRLVLFYIGACIWGVGMSIRQPSFLAFFSEKTEDSRRKHLFSMLMFSHTLVSAGSIWLAGRLPGWHADLYGTNITDGYRMTFLMGWFFILLCMVPLLFTKESRGGYQKKKEVDPLPRREIMKLASPLILLGVGAGFVIPFFPLYFKWRFDIALSDIGELFALTHLLWALAYLAMPLVAERLGSVKAIITVQTIAVLALFGIPLTTSFPAVAAFYVIRMVMMNATWPILQSYALSRVPDDHRSFTLGSMQFSFNFCGGVSRGFAGHIYGWSLSLPFFITGVLYSIATLLFFMLFGNKDDRKIRPIRKSGAGK